MIEFLRAGHEHRNTKGRREEFALLGLLFFRAGVFGSAVVACRKRIIVVFALAIVFRNKKAGEIPRARPLPQKLARLSMRLDAFERSNKVGVQRPHQVVSYSSPLFPHEYSMETHKSRPQIGLGIGEDRVAS